jgi:hypothetical protein
LEPLSPDLDGRNRLSFPQCHALLSLILTCSTAHNSTVKKDEEIDTPGLWSAEEGEDGVSGKIAIPGD